MRSNRNSVEVTTEPTLEPITLDQAKDWAKIDTVADDELITDLIVAARKQAEEFTRRRFINTTLTMTLDRFPKTGKEQWWDGVRDGAISEIERTADKIELPFPPLVSVTSVTTYDEDNSSTVFDSSNYLVDTAGSRIVLNSGSVWPTALRDYAAIVIVYVCGYGTDAPDVPEAIRTAIKMHVQAMYDERTACEMPDSCIRLLKPYKIYDSLSRNA